MSNEKRLLDINKAMSAWLTKNHEAMKGGEQLSTAYETPGMTNDQIDSVALAVLKTMNGFPVHVIRQVLNRAEFWAGAVTTLDCGPATEFARAFEALQRAADGSP